MNRSPIQQHTSAIIKGFIAESEALKNLHHTVLKGRLRELFTSNVLSKFLTNQFGIGTGVIINQRGDQSKELDIIIYDNRIIPPFIQEQKIGVYPAECVLGIIEVRSWISKNTIREYAESANKIFNEIYDPASSLYPKEFEKMKPYYNLLGLYDKELFAEATQQEILIWMVNNAKPLWGVCLVNNLSWVNVVTVQGPLHMKNEYNEETKAFIAIVLDNIRTESQRRYFSFSEHTDWLSIYLRDQTGIRAHFKRTQNRTRD